MTKKLLQSFLISIIFGIGFFITLIISLKVQAVVSSASPGSALSANNRNELLTQVFQKNGSNLYYNTGNIGIGTNSPVGQLQIAGTYISNPIYYETNVDRPSIGITGKYPQLILFGGGSNNLNSGPTITLGAYDSGNSGTFKHWSIGVAGNDASFLDIGYSSTDMNPHAGLRGYNGTTFLTILKTGKVGIGTTNPTEKLEINGNMLLSGPGTTNLKINSTNSSSPRLSFYNGGTYDRGWQGYSNGCMYARDRTENGVVICQGQTSFSANSDIRLKTNIQYLTGVLNTLTGINTVFYNWKKSPNTNKELGLIAQEIEKYYPELIFEDEKGYKRIPYDRIGVIGIQAIKELKIQKDAEIQELKNEIQNIKNQLIKN